MIHPPLAHFITPGMGAELIYSFVIILCSLFVYFETKKLYELSAYKGIKYFRQAFLFFAGAYFFRYFIKFLTGYFNLTPNSVVSPKLIGDLSLFLFIFFSTMAIFCLIYSIMLKNQYKNSKKIYLFYSASLLTAIVSIFFKHFIVYLGINVILFISALILFFKYHKKNKKKNSLSTIYPLLFMFWSLNIIDILIPNFLQNLQLGIYLVSIGLFITMLYKVTKKAGSI